MNDRIAGAARAAVLGALLAAAAQAGERFEGTIADTAGALPGANITFFTLQIDGLSTDEEMKALFATLEGKGQNGLMDVLWDLPEKGFVRIGGSLGYDVTVVRSIQEGDERIVRAVTDRPIQFFEVRHGLRSRDYPLGIVELRLGKDGKGTGRLIAAAKVEFDESGKLEIESFGTTPFKIMNVRTEATKGRD